LEFCKCHLCPGLGRWQSRRGVERGNGSQVPKCSWKR